MGVETATPPPAGLDHMDSSSFESNQLEASLPVAGSGGCANGAATKLQKVYRGYRTRRKLADGSLPVAGSGGCVNEAATKLQKVYRGYRTRRKLADSAAVVELWWQLLEFAQLSHSTVSFDDPKPETGASR